MPEFQLDHGTAKASNRFAMLDQFTSGYIEAAFFCGLDDRDSGSLADLAAETWARMEADCRAFQEAHADALDRAYCNESIPYEAIQAGRDFWFTRCGHGVGFWSRDLGEVGDELTDAAHAEGTVDLYFGDDELIYLA